MNLLLFPNVLLTACGPPSVQKKALTWELQNWLRDAQTRTDDFRAHGPRGPTTWVLTEGHNIPDGAIVGGSDNGSPLYIARALIEGGLQVGKAGRGLSKGASVGYKHKEYEVGLEMSPGAIESVLMPTGTWLRQVNKYEILLGDPRAVRWVDAKGALHLDRLNARPVEGGREPDGTPQYIAQAEHGGGTHPGKAATIFEGAFVPYGGKEKKEEHYRVLCYN